MSLSDSFASHLDGARDSAQVMAHARLLMKLARLYEAVMPGTLARFSRVANIKAGIVVIHAESGAVAAKIKQSTGRLANELRQRGVECSGVEVRVQPPGPKPQPAAVSQRTLSPSARKTLEQAAERMPKSSKLRSALDELLRCSAGSEDRSG